MNQEILSGLEIDTIGEIMNISMGSAATAASTLLDNKVSITTPIVDIVPTDEFDIVPMEPAIAVEIKYVEGISGSNILILRQADVRTILGQMMMMEMDENFVIDEIAESAICELMNQMMGSSATVLSCFLGRTINISTPTTVPVDELEKFKAEHFPRKENLLTIQFTISIKDIMESKFISVMDIDLAKEIISVSLNFDTGESEADAAASARPVPAATSIAEQPSAAMPQAPAAPKPPVAPPQASPAPQPQAAEQVQPPVPQQGYATPPAGYPQYPPYYPPYPPQQPYPMPPQGYGYSPQQAVPMPPAEPIKIQDYSYADFGGGAVAGIDHANLDLVMNVPVVVTVELGRTKRKIKEILEFGQGTIVELDKQAGSHVDVIVNGQLIARGDVVVVDDNFSIRITEILKNRDAISLLE